MVEMEIMLRTVLFPSYWLISSLEQGSLQLNITTLVSESVEEDHGVALREVNKTFLMLQTPSHCISFANAISPLQLLFFVVAL